MALEGSVETCPRQSWQVCLLCRKSSRVGMLCKGKSGLDSLHPRVRESEGPRRPRGKPEALLASNN